jgi:hypothetical protein
LTPVTASSSRNISGRIRIGRRLILLNRHEIAFAVGEIEFAANSYPMVVLGAGIFLVYWIKPTPIEA